MRRQSLDIDALLSDELEKALDVALLGPTHVWQRVIVAALLVLRIVTAWPIRHRNDQLELTTKKRRTGYVHACHTDDDNSSFKTRDTRRQLDRLIRISRRSDQNGISAVASGPRLDLLCGSFIRDDRLVSPQLQR